MRSCLGLSIGATNLVAVPAGRPPTVRSAVLTLFGHRPAEVGVPSENPRLDERGLVLTGFVERVGDPVPIVASDGSAHSGERLVVDALEALIRSAGLGRPPERTVVAVPAHWRDSVVDALRAQLPGTPVVSDAVAALTALRAEPGLPARGIVALCDFGATGTSITLADAAAGFRRVGQTVRYDEFSGDQIDQAIVKYVLADLDVDPSSTSAVVALTRFREQCRLAKERLSAQTATGLAGPMPGPQSTVRLTRAELEALIRDPLDGLIGALQDVLRRNNIHPADLAAVATVGGGARIPLVTQRLSEAMRIPVTTSPQAQVVGAVGAELIAGRDPEAEAATLLAATPLAAAPIAAAPAVPAPLAWSADDGTDDLESAIEEARPEIHFDDRDFGDVDRFPPLPWYRRPGVLFGAAAGLAVVASVGFILTVRNDDMGAVPAGSTGTSASMAPPVASQPLEAPAPAAPVAQIPAPVQVVATQPASVPRQTQAPPVRRVAPQRTVVVPAPAAPAACAAARSCGATAGARSTAAGSITSTAFGACARSRHDGPRHDRPRHDGPRHDGPRHRPDTRHDGPRDRPTPARRTPARPTPARRTPARPIPARRTRARPIPGTTTRAPRTPAAARRSRAPMSRSASPGRAPRARYSSRFLRHGCGSSSNPTALMQISLMAP